MSVQIKKAGVEKPSKASAQKPPGSNELTVIAKVIKGDTYMVMADSAKELDDEYEGTGLYKGDTMAAAVIPPYNPKTLKNLVLHNNVLNQCIHAMEVNIDGTGHEFVPADEQREIDPKEKEAAEQFFNEPYPGKSFVAMRRDMRRDVESIGWGALEVLHNLQRDPVAVRYLDAQSLRLARLGTPVAIKRRLMRNGQEVELEVMERPRRFIQLVNGLTRQYFKEFGVELDLNRKTGEWAEPGQVLPPDVRATELLFFGADKDTTTPYHVPKWINQMPSVVGSRKAEESNLEFFDSGGMPPAIIFIQGGNMVGESATQLRTYLSAGNKKRGRAVVVELAATSGDINSSGSVSAKVERFGAERANDSMYTNYDNQAEEHVRVGFRLPPLFLGRADDYNYATAVVAYQVAEAQVFGPERLEFDEVINKTLIKALKWKTLKFKSLPITLKSVDETFKGLELLDGKVDEQQFVEAVNKQIGTDLKHDPEAVVDPNQTIEPTDPVTGKPVPTPPANLQQKGMMDRLHMLKLARKYAVAEGWVEGTITDEERTQVAESVRKIDNPDTARRFVEACQLLSVPAKLTHAH